MSLGGSASVQDEPGPWRHLRIPRPLRPLQLLLLDRLPAHHPQHQHGEVEVESAVAEDAQFFVWLRFALTGEEEGHCPLVD